ncbi:MAG: GLUG motif-containing protein, partial [Planctomycetota bacterium]
MGPVSDWDKCFKLMADIDLSGYTGTQFNIIGIDIHHPFTGVFDGNGHTISNFTYTSTGTRYIGLFGHVGEWVVNAEIKNLGLIDPDVDAGTGWFVGSLVGYLREGTITNCYVEDSSVSGNIFVGGLVGSNSGTITNCCSKGIVSGDKEIGGLVGSNGGTITNCYETGSVKGNFDVGGLVGMSGEGTITNCYATGSVKGNFGVGGLVGWDYESTISNSYSTGSVTGTGIVGGLVGSNGGTITNCCSTCIVTSTGSPFGGSVGGLVGSNREGTITNCYATGSVTGYYEVGGLVGYNRYGTITKCYSTGSVSGNEKVGGLVGCDWTGGRVFYCFWDIETSEKTWSSGGTGKTTAEMQTMSTFTDTGWDFVGETVNGTEDIWFIPQQDYPHLWWEEMQVPMKL